MQFYMNYLFEPKRTIMLGALNVSYVGLQTCHRDFWAYRATSDTLPTLVLHVSDDVASDPVLRHRAGVALLGLDALWPPEHSPERGRDAAPVLAAPCGPRAPGEPQGAEEESLLALHLLHMREGTHAEERRR